MAAAEVFKLFGSIGVDTKDAEAGLDRVGEKGKDTEKKLSFGEQVNKSWAKIDSASQALLGVVTSVGAAAGAATVVAIKQAGELEQNLGGSEAVFGKYANSLQKTARTAFYNMGLSTSDYLATANKMGSLFRGAGFEVDEAMQLSQAAMLRAADVASIMGVDINWAMESIAGAAKGNFTMMDNLGVAMNDTTLNAYALEKGIGKTTQQMTNAEKIGLAMEMFLERTAYAAGNYAKENDTFSGSLTTMKAAYANVSAELATQFLPKLTAVFNAITKFLTNDPVGKLKEFAPVFYTIGGAITLAVLPAVLGLVAGFASAMIAISPLLIAGAALGALFFKIKESSGLAKAGFIALAVAVGAFTAAMMAAKVATVAQTIASGAMAAKTIIVDGATKLWTASQWLLNAALSANPIGIVIVAITALIAAIIYLWNTNEGFREMIIAVWTAIKEFFWASLEWIRGAWETTWEAIKSFLEMVWDAILAFLTVVVGIPLAIINTILLQPLLALWNAVWGAIKDVFSAFWNFIKPFIMPIIQWISNFIKTSFDAIKNTIATILGAIQSTITTVWNAIKSFVSGAVNAIQSTISSVFNAIKSTVTSIWNGIKSAIEGPINKARDIVKSAIDKIKGFFNFNISWPKIPMPRFSIDPSGWKIGDLLKGSIPKLGIDWFAKGGILRSPTIFGMTGEKAMVGGEAGHEAVLPLNRDTLGQIGEGIASTMGSSNDSAILEAMLAEIKQLREDQKDLKVMMDSGELVGAIRKKVDKALENDANLRRRGVTI